VSTGEAGADAQDGHGDAKEADLLLHRAAAVFRDAIEAEPARRAALLDDRCRGDDALRARVEAMLERDGRSEHERASGAATSSRGTVALAGIHAIPSGFASEILRDFVGSPGAPSPGPSGRLLAPGDRVGRYEVVRRIAEGGSSVVYEASQSEPARRVALKVHRFAILSAGGLARFREETRILGHLQHAGIAHVYEASIGEGDGSDVGAAHWIAMELVPDAMPITRYCRAHRLELRRRLELFRTVCDAVAHAHQRGVIHRDLKPANILVGSNGVPKVIDFGIGRLADVTARTRVTVEGQILGTFEYMSPEQCAGDPTDVDVRSDVYGLGLCLYELVFGEPARDLTGRTPLEVLHAVTRVGIQPPASTESSAPPDLQTIVLHAVEIERGDRYQSVQALTDDLGRFLRAEPIEARPPSMWRRLQLFARRNKLVAALLIIASATLIAYLVTVPALMQTARRNREEAARMQREHQEASHAITTFSLRRGGDAESGPYYIAVPLFGDDRRVSRGVAITVMPDDHDRWNRIVVIDGDARVVSAFELDLKPPVDVVGLEAPPSVGLGSVRVADVLSEHDGAEVILRLSSEASPQVSAIVILDLKLVPLSTVWTSGFVREVVWSDRSGLLVISLVTGALGSFEPRFAAMDARMCVGSGGHADIVPVVLAVKPEATDGILLPARGREPANLVRAQWAVARLPDEFEDDQWRGRFTAFIADAAEGDHDAVARIDMEWAAPDAKWKWSTPNRLYSLPIDAEGNVARPPASTLSDLDVPAQPRFAPIDFSALQIAAGLSHQELNAIILDIDDMDDAGEPARRIRAASPSIAQHPDVARSVVESIRSNWRDLHRIADELMQVETPVDPARHYRTCLALAERAQLLHDLRCPSPDECQAACYCRGVLAEALYRNGRTVEALELLERIESTWLVQPISQDPIAFALTLAWKARCLAELGRMDEARAALAGGKACAEDCDSNGKYFSRLERLLALAEGAIDPAGARGDGSPADAP